MESKIIEQKSWYYVNFIQLAILPLAFWVVAIWRIGVWQKKSFLNQTRS